MVVKSRNLFGVTCLVLSLVLAGCSGGGSSSSSEAPAPEEVTGIVADGYLRGVTVFADMNGNKKLDEGEPSTESGVGGKYTLPASAKGHPLMAIVTTEALDEDNLSEADKTIETADLDGVVAAAAQVQKPYTLSTPAGQTNINPLTTLAQAKIEKGESVDAASAAEALKAQLGITQNDIYSDFHADQSGEAEITTLRQASQVVARTMAGVQELIEGEATGAGATGDDIAGKETEVVEGTIALVLAELDRIVEKLEAFQQEFDAYQQALANDEEVAEPEFNADDLADSVVDEGALDLTTVTRIVTSTLDTDGDGITNDKDTDADDDGVPDDEDAFPFDATRSADTDGDGIDDEVDNDNCPTTPNFRQADFDSDGMGDKCDEDIDGDGVANDLDAFPFDTARSADTDGDGIDNAYDNCVSTSNFLQADLDQDSIGDKCDDDIDGDGVLNGSDAFPLDAAESVDTDGDGIGNNADTDDDGDGVADPEDAFPLDKTESVDTDGDGTGNNTDTDDDGDGVADAQDAFPLDGSESVDTDGDGIGNNADTDDDGDGVADASDAFPLNSAESVDTDGDGTGNNADTDDDGDGVADAQDAFPLDGNETADIDGDGTGNNADLDDDNDGVVDAEDAFPLDAAESVDTDGDGNGNNADADDDNDGLTDTEEASRGTNPLIADTDNDGLSDGVEVNTYGTNPLKADSDGDGITDAGEVVAGTNPNKADTDSDGLSDSEELNGVTDPTVADTDGDGLIDGNEIIAETDPLNPDSDGDGLSDGDEIGANTNPLLADTDGDGLNDGTEVSDGTNPKLADTDGDGYYDGEDLFPLDAAHYGPPLVESLDKANALLETAMTTGSNGTMLEAAVAFETANDKADDPEAVELPNEADTARFFYALTHVARVAFDTQADNGNLNNLGGLLDRFGVDPDFTLRDNYDTINLPETCEQVTDDSGAPLFEMDGVTPVMDCEMDPLPSDAPTSGQVLGFVESQLGGDQGALANAISALGLISENFNYIHTESDTEWNGFEDVPVTEETEIDYSDVLFIRGIARGLQAQINILQAYDLNVDIDAVENEIRTADAEVESCKSTCESDHGYETSEYWSCADACYDHEYNPLALFGPDSTLLTVKDQEKLRLKDARDQLKESLGYLKEAIEKVRDESDKQDNDFVTFFDCYWDDYQGQEVCSTPEEMGQEIKETLTDIQKALDMLAAAEVGSEYPLTTDDMGTEDPADDERVIINPAAFFDGEVNFGDNLPIDETGEPSLFPDGTMYGLFPNGELNTDEDGDQIPDLLQDGSFERFTDARLAGNTFSFNHYDQEYGRETVRILLTFNEDHTFAGQRIDFSEISRSTTPLSGTWAAGAGNGWKPGSHGRLPDSRRNRHHSAGERG
jgi:hypothetical protein